MSSQKPGPREYALCAVDRLRAVRIRVSGVLESALSNDLSLAESDVREAVNGLEGVVFEASERLDQVQGRAIALTADEASALHDVLKDWAYMARERSESSEARAAGTLLRYCLVDAHGMNPTKATALTHKLGFYP